MLFSAVRLVSLQRRPTAQGMRARKQTAQQSTAACFRALVSCAAPSASSRTAILRVCTPPRKRARWGPRASAFSACTR